ncbi:malic enzyme-like NAD(P)-binding protein [Candidatus Phytoplasma sp. AldY-WA1]|uniref:malic enzyme-like NAD(P)-binding protein n=1 Tax=Candidatus Phytoplasma sp. AldY-WA1 TaxID=2852100 RepID=UPI00254E2F0F|nr:malic enzyme-like NAD(P)-binding protein [Candidatus Phytoplasma sp. AldY-WA1]
MPDEAEKGGVKVIAMGRSDFPNQINNCLSFPGIFRGVLNVKATKINEEMKKAVIYALKNIIKIEDLNENNILPNFLINQYLKKFLYQLLKQLKKLVVLKNKYYKLKKESY